MYTVFIFFLSILPYVFTQDPVVNLPQGRVVGIKVYSENSQTPVEIFFGIPYATPPTGRLRFSPPERHTGWRRTLFAHRLPPRCPEYSEDSDAYSEDCLYLNIWTSRRVDSKLQPVVIILFSDSWSRGGINLPCQELAVEGVVVVTVTYRLNIFAFFTLKSVLARGNLALLDQYMAMLWVRENIAAFGGDPAAVSLVGHSAGADCVLLHAFSPRSVGLFHRAIVMSPQDTILWKTVDRDTDNNNPNLSEAISREAAVLLGCGNKTDREILQCMKSLPFKNLTAIYTTMDSINTMQPTSDHFLPASEQYLPYSLAKALAAAKASNIQLDLLMGSNDFETLGYDNKTMQNFIKIASSGLYDHARNKIIPEILQLLSLDQSQVLPTLVQAVSWEFFGVNTRESEKDYLTAIEAISKMETSAKWGAGMALLAARLARRISRLYVYRYSQSSRIDLYGKPISFAGSVHGADLLALLGDPLMLQVARRPSTQDEKQISTQYRKYILNFIKFGTPSTEREWPRYMIGDSNIHTICDKQFTTSCSINEVNKDSTFWLQYLPRLAQTISSIGRTEMVTGENDDSRLRGGVFALCGVTAILILLLLLSVIFLRRVHRRSDVIE